MMTYDLPEITLKQGATDHSLLFELFRLSDGTRHDFTGNTLKTFTMFRNGVKKVDGKALVEVDAANGEFRHDWLLAERDTPGVYQGEVKIVDAAGKTYIFPKDGYMTINIIENVQ